MSGRNSDCIEPMIIYGPGKCTLCGGALVVVDMEVNFVQLAPNGTPVDEETMINCEGVCMDCELRYPMLRDGLNYLHDNEYNRLTLWYKHLKKQEAIAKKMDELKPKPDNPFCINFA